MYSRLVLTVRMVRRRLCWDWSMRRGFHCILIVCVWSSTVGLAAHRAPMPTEPMTTIRIVKTTLLSIQLKPSNLELFDELNLVYVGKTPVTQRLATTAA